jgi:hypothetical protein
MDESESVDRPPEQLHVPPNVLLSSVGLWGPRKSLAEQPLGSETLDMIDGGRGVLGHEGTTLSFIPASSLLPFPLNTESC